MTATNFGKAGALIGMKLLENLRVFVKPGKLTDKPIIANTLSFEELLENRIRGNIGDAFEHNKDKDAERSPSSEVDLMEEDGGELSRNSPVLDDVFDIVLEKEVLTPARMANRENWENIKRAELKELKEFEELEKQCAESPEEQEDDREGRYRDMYSDHRLHLKVGNIPDGREPSEFSERILTAVSEECEGGAAASEQPFTGRNPLLDDSAMLSDSNDSAGWPASDQIGTTRKNYSVLFSEAGSASFAEVEDDERQSVRRDQGATTQQEEATFAPSTLLYKLFPGLKDSVAKSATRASESLSSSAHPIASTTVPTSSAEEDACTVEDLKEKLKALEEEVTQYKAEIARYKESDGLTKRIREENDKAMQKNRAERAAFEDYKKTELQKLQDMKEEQSRQLKRERQNWEKQRRAAEILPTKRERQEIELLRKQMAELEDRFKKKEDRATLAQERLKRRIDELTKRNSELQEEVKVLEHERAAYVERNDKRLSLPVGSNKQPLVVNHTKASVQQAAPPVRETPILATTVPSNGPTPPKKSPVANVTSPHPATLRFEAMEAQLKLPSHMEERVTVDGKRERTYPQGRKLVWYVNGTIKEIHPDGRSAIYFTNGDYKKVTPEGSVIYWYAEPKTKHTTYKDGLQVYEFENGQKEKHYPDGTNEITFSDGTLKYIFANGEVNI
ncbi:hypothetical protein HK104_007305 [Borealophlyctis nickersoniae]|nr:hypothetical protein HK104_007305 [Borealophlyctis nickersoniae]